MKALRAKNPRVPSETQRETGAGRGGGGVGEHPKRLHVYATGR